MTATPTSPPRDLNSPDADFFIEWMSHNMCQSVPGDR
jgi:hypothetical protein